MKFEREIRELEQKLEELKKAASEEKNYKIIVTPVIEGCFDDMPKEYGINGALYRRFKLYDPTDKTYSHRQACAKFNVLSTGRLMSKEEIHLLIACGILRQEDTSFWSSSVVSYDRVYAWQFDGYYGIVFNYDRLNDYAVRCVARP